MILCWFVFCQTSIQQFSNRRSAFESEKQNCVFCITCVCQQSSRRVTNLPLTVQYHACHFV